MPWLAIALEVDAAQAGPMSDALLELGAQSVTIEDADAETEREAALHGAQDGAGHVPHPCRVLDYGCGSGILALAAAKLGASEIAAVDLDPQALEACATTARANGVALLVTPPDALPPGDYDVIAANILAQPLIALAPLFAARARAGARIALCGVLEDQAAPVIAAYDPNFDLCIERVRDGWALVAGACR